MHHSLICILSGLAVLSSVLGLTLDPSVAIVALAIGIAAIGVPHGSLDHVFGRRLLEPRLGRFWRMSFFAAYSTTAVVVAAGWLIMPLATAIFFFIVSAWHFGMEDEPVTGLTGWRRHRDAIALGGMLIWVPSLFRAEEMRGILSSIVPSAMPISSPQIVFVTQGIALLMLAIAMFAVAATASSPFRWWVALRYVTFAILFATTPILVSFGIYFCLWHSVRGLQFLKTEMNISLVRFVAALLPLTIGAAMLIGIGAFWWSEGRTVSSELTRSIFIGLSAIAVPHLLLHAAAGTSIVRRWAVSGSSVQVVAREPNFSVATQSQHGAHA